VALGSLFAREARWVRHNAGVLVLVLLVLPSLFAVSTVAFQQVIPRDTPIAVVPESESVSEDEIDAVTGVAAFFSRPHDYESRDVAERALAREEVYAIFVVPHGLFDEEASVVTVEGTVSYSSSSCGEVALKRATYEPGGSAATVRVVGRRDPEAGEECTDDIAADSYRVELTFDMGVPDTVEVTEDGEFDEFVVTAP